MLCLSFFTSLVTKDCYIRMLTISELTPRHWWSSFVAASHFLLHCLCGIHTVSEVLGIVIYSWSWPTSTFIPLNLDSAGGFRNIIFNFCGQLLLRSERTSSLKSPQAWTYCSANFFGCSFVEWMFVCHMLSLCKMVVLSASLDVHFV